MKTCTINRIWMRLNILGAVVMLGTLIYSAVTKDMQPLRFGLVAWAVTYVFRLMNNKCKRCGQNYNPRTWRAAGPDYKICPRCGTRHQIL